MAFTITEESHVNSDEQALSTASIKRAFLDKLFYLQGKFPALATKQDYYLALAHVVRDQMLQRWISTAAAYTASGARTVAYLSAEFLMGPHLGNNLMNLGIYDEVAEAVAELGLDINDLLLQEEEPGLGNGGLGRLAACFLDSLATLEIPSVGYGIRYEFGIFDQEIIDGWQVEKTDKWLRYGNPWEIHRPEWAVTVKFGGYVESYQDDHNRSRKRWVPGRTVKGTPYDTPILGYHNNTANSLRLWQAEAHESFDFASFNRGDYYRSVEQKMVSENITKVLYPNDEQYEGKRLRLEQQYFFVSCAIQDMFRILDAQQIPLSKFHEKFTVQLNDTHPAIAVAELMRILLDWKALSWNEAWAITCRTFAYTNHTLLPEALERWPLEMIRKSLPRHVEIIYEINAQFLDDVRLRFMGQDDKIARLSLIDESGERYIRMANLACVGSFAINGVAALHSELLKQDILKDFYELSPEKFRNKTNGVTPRRWVVLSNPRLSKLITTSIGENWIKDLTELNQLEPLATDASFSQSWSDIKRFNKVQFSNFAKAYDNLNIDPESMFDVQVKRIHEYKRQHLNILHVIYLYHRIKSEPNFEIQPRTFIFGGKAAPGYHLAKLIIRLITAVGEIVNRDPMVRGRLNVVFLPNFNVTNGQLIYPAAELSEQISTAGKEASGTGNMKFSMNGALTIGTLDGANVEIREEVGADNFFLFGLTAEEVFSLKLQGYNPYKFYENNENIKEVIRLIQCGYFSRGDTELFKPLLDNLLFSDPYLVLADFQAYIDCQEKVDQAYQKKQEWTRMSIINTARSGKFSSDRAIREYCEDIWKVKPVKVRLLNSQDVSGGFLQ